MPTTKQMIACIRICQTLSNFYTDIHLFRYDSKRQEIYILAGETIGITIFINGDCELDNETET